VDHLLDVDGWLADLQQRHLANLTRPELTRALRALSSCYVERRGKLAEGGALESAGKRAAFALYYGTLHFFTVGAVVRALGAHTRPIDGIVDIGCGTGVGAAAWAAACATPPPIAGVDRSAWAVSEANWTYARLGIPGRARTGDITRGRLNGVDDRPLFLGYVLNELPDATRDRLLEHLVARAASSGPLLIVEAIARRDKPWWPQWIERLGAAGARADEWRFPAEVPPFFHDLARAAGLHNREITARTIWRE
jgi:hypothetical protein